MAAGPGRSCPSPDSSLTLGTVETPWDSSGRRRENQGPLEAEIAIPCPSSALLLPSAPGWPAPHLPRLCIWGAPGAGLEEAPKASRDSAQPP